MKALDHPDAPARAAIRRVLENPLFELIPVKNALAQAKHLPDGATVSVTASPAKGMDATLDLAEALQQLGFAAVPHLSAKLIADRTHLEQMLDRLNRLGITRVFVMGGDGEEPSEFYDGLSLLTAMDEIGHNLSEIGIAAYPEGHAVIPASALGRALLDKQPLASSMTTQMCFRGKTIVDWLADQREAGITLPVSLGMPGVADPSCSKSSDRRWTIPSWASTEFTSSPSTPVSRPKVGAGSIWRSCDVGWLGHRSCRRSSLVDATISHAN